MNVFAIQPQEDIMAPRSGPTLQGVKSKLRQFQQMAGGSLIGQMEERGSRQKEHWGLGRRSPMPLTEGDMNIADSLAGSLMGSIRAYHGSPHRFDKFSLDKIGTGEGAQAYGHGLYFAEKEGTARAYQSNVSRARGFDVPTVHGVNDDFAKRLIALAARNDNDLQSIAGDLKYRIENAGRGESVAIGGMRWDKSTARKALKAIESGKAKIGEPGALYTTKLNVEPEDLLDWDKPLSEQSEKVQRAIYSRAEELLDDPKAIINERWFDDLEAGRLTGSQIYRALGRGTDETSSQEWLRRGIPGIRYLDQGSRGYKVRLSLKGKPYGDEPRDFATKAQADAYAAEKQAEGFQAEVAQDGTRNFVIFDDSLVDITHVDGKPLTKAERKAALAELEGKSP